MGLSKFGKALFGQDVEVGDLAGTGIVYGSTRNINKGTDLAFEYTAAGKPDPTLAVHVPVGQANHYVEFDWYTTNAEGKLILIDAQNIGKGASAYDFREGSTFSSTSWGRDAQEEIMADALKQSEAAKRVGAMVEWRVPSGTPDEVVEALEKAISNKDIENIVVVKVKPNTP